MTDSPVGNGVHTEALLATINVAKKRRHLARLQFRATDTWVRGTHSPRLVCRPWGPGLAPVGDAGYYTDAITAHGVSDARLDAQLLADATAVFLAGGLGEDAAMGETTRRAPVCRYGCSR
jgi:flavin-dependent dehydrogenase